jgi:trehalose 6-phosphate phosphatase
MPTHLDDLPHALDHLATLNRRLAGNEPAVFLDYDGTLTPIVDRPEDAVISESMREAVRALAERCTVCVVSGRDRAVVQELMGLRTLVVAGSHGFDIWAPDGGTIEREEGREFEALMDEVETRLRSELADVDGALIEPKKVGVAVHDRLVADADRSRIRDAVEAVLADHPGELKVTPGKRVYEVQPRIDWDKGKAVRYLLDALGLDRPDVVPLYLGDDVTDEHAFEALGGDGIGIFVGDAEDPEVAGRTTAADYLLRSPEEVERFLDGLAR